MSSRGSSPITWIRKGLSPGPRGSRRAGLRPSGICSTDSDHLINTTLVCDASGAAMVAAGLVVGARTRARTRTGCRDGFGHLITSMKRFAGQTDGRIVTVRRESCRRKGLFYYYTHTGCLGLVRHSGRVVPRPIAGQNHPCMALGQPFEQLLRARFARPLFSADHPNEASKRSLPGRPGAHREPAEAILPHARS